jgi:hypothetical protein
MRENHLEPDVLRIVMSVFGGLNSFAEDGDGLSYSVYDLVGFHH